MKDFDRVVNCPLCCGTLECFHYSWATELNWSKAYTNQKEYADNPAYSYSRVRCPLCDGTGTVLARLTNASTGCRACGGAGAIETTVKLDIGVRREKRECGTCGGSGKRTQQRIEIQTFAPAPQTYYFHFDDGQQHSIHAQWSSVTIDLEGAAKEFFAKWHPASESTYVRERRERERQKAEQEEAKQRELQATELQQRRIREGLCTRCGGSLGFMDRLAGRESHKRCP